MPSRKLTDFHYKNKNIFLRFADGVNRKSVYQIWRGRKVTFLKNPSGEDDYKAGRFKNKYPCISYLFFVVTLPLLPITMSIKCLSKENKRKFKEMKDIDANKLAKAQAKKMESEERRMKREIRKKKKKKKEIIEKEVLKRIESPTLGKMRLLIDDIKVSDVPFSNPTIPPEVQQEELFASDIQLEILGEDSNISEEQNDLEKGEIDHSSIATDDEASQAVAFAKSNNLDYANENARQNVFDWLRFTANYYLRPSAPDIESAIQAPLPISIES